MVTFKKILRYGFLKDFVEKFFNFFYFSNFNFFAADHTFKNDYFCKGVPLTSSKISFWSAKYMFPTSDSWGFFFSDFLYLKEHQCQISACYYFFQVKTLNNWPIIELITNLYKT